MRGRALFLVQVVVGYEWLVSGLTKLSRGDFPGGLAAWTADAARHDGGWYGSFLANAVEPHARTLGVAIEAGELTVGAVLLAGALAALAGHRLGRTLELATALALAAGLVLAANFELAAGGGFGTRLAADSFDEGVDLDTIMVGLQLALLVPAAASLRRRARGDRPRSLKARHVGT